VQAPELCYPPNAIEANREYSNVSEIYISHAEIRGIG